MATKRKTYRFRGGRILDVEEYHDGNYGSPGMRRRGKRKPTPEQVQVINRQNKTRNCRRRLLAYFEPGDLFATWTYEVKNRPPDMCAALADFQKAMRKVRAAYKKRGKTLRWIRNIERGTKGAWHIHLIVNEIGESASILQQAWKHGATWSTEIRNSRFYDEDFTKLASYITKDERTPYMKADGTPGKPRIREANYNISRNMPLPEPVKKELVRWQREVHPKKGYYIAGLHEGISPLGFMYRRYTMIRLEPEPRKRKRKRE